MPHEPLTRAGWRKPYTIQLTAAERQLVEQAAHASLDLPRTFARKAILRSSLAPAQVDTYPVPAGAETRTHWNLSLSREEQATLNERAQAAALGPRVWARAIVLATARQVLGEEAP